MLFLSFLKGHKVINWIFYVQNPKLEPLFCVSGNPVNLTHKLAMFYQKKQNVFCMHCVFQIFGVISNSVRWDRGVLVTQG